MGVELVLKSAMYSDLIQYTAFDYITDLCHIGIWDIDVLHWQQVEIEARQSLSCFLTAHCLVPMQHVLVPIYDVDLQCYLCHRLD